MIPGITNNGRKGGPPLLAAATAALLILAACGGGGSPAAGPAEGGPPQTRAVATLPLIADFVRQVGGERVEVLALLPAGADPHTFEPTPRQIQRVAEADIAFINGLGLEPALRRVMEANLPAGVPLIPIAERIQPPDQGPADPHLWLDIDNARQYARIVRDGLAHIDPAGASTYDENLRRYLALLDETDDYVRQEVAAVPPERRKLVTAHSAFGHLARYLGFQLAAYAAASPEQEPSPRDLERLISAIRSLGVPAVFQEPQLGPTSQLLRQAAAEAGARVCTLYSDALDDRVTSYVELMRFNADELARCLGGESDG